MKTIYFKRKVEQIDEVRERGRDYYHHYEHFHFFLILNQSLQFTHFPDRLWIPFLEDLATSMPYKLQK